MNRGRTAYRIFLGKEAKQVIIIPGANKKTLRADRQQGPCRALDWALRSGPASCRVAVSYDDQSVGVWSG